MLVKLGMVTKERPEGWEIVSTLFHRPNMVGCVIFTGIKRTNLIMAYLRLPNMDHLPDLEETLNHFLGRDTIIMGT